MRNFFSSSVLFFRLITFPILVFKFRRLLKPLIKWKETKDLFFFSVLEHDLKVTISNHVIVCDYAVKSCRYCGFINLHDLWDCKVCKIEHDDLRFWQLVLVSLPWNWIISRYNDCCLKFPLQAALANKETSQK